MKFAITDLLSYRYRYHIGYGLFVVLLGGLLVLAGLFIPGGIRIDESSSTITSNALSVVSLWQNPGVNVPYHLLQKLSISLLGLSAFAIKLPSLILGLIAAVALLLLLRQWFRHNVAIIASVLAVTSGQFLVVSQAGTATVMFMLWPVVLLLLATLISQKTAYSKLWIALLIISVALSLYTPLMVYVVIAMALSAVFHPHLRFMLGGVSKPVVVLAGSLALIILAPLTLQIYHTPAIGLDLLGIVDKFSIEIAYQNIKTLFKAYFGFGGQGITSGVLTPLYGFAALALIVLGLLKLIADHHSARSYTLGVLIILAAGLLVIDPVHIIFATVPSLLLLAVGIETLLHNWYRLFPKNPYARFAALAPLAILVSGMVYSGLDRYVNGYQHSSEVSTSYSRDISLVRRELATSSGAITLVTAPGERNFYHILKREYPNLVVTSEAPTVSTGKTLVTSSAAAEQTSSLQALGTPVKLITNSYQADSLRLRVY